MRAAGIRRYSDPVELLELPRPGELRADEVLLEVRFCGVGNWDEITRSGGWDLGRHPPMALGVEAAGIVAGTGGAVTGLAVGDRVMTHSVPLRFQGAWAQWFVAAAADVARVPAAVPLDVAADRPALNQAQGPAARTAAVPGHPVTISKAEWMICAQLCRYTLPITGHPYRPAKTCPGTTRRRLQITAVLVSILSGGRDGLTGAERADRGGVLVRRAAEPGKCRETVPGRDSLHDRAHGGPVFRTLMRAIVGNGVHLMARHSRRVPVRVRQLSCTGAMTEPAGRPRGGACRVAQERPRNCAKRPRGDEHSSASRGIRSRQQRIIGARVSQPGL
jgi:hypothetical protein